MQHVLGGAMERSVGVSVRVRTEECVTLLMGCVDVDWAGPDNTVKKVNKHSNKIS